MDMVSCLCKWKSVICMQHSILYMGVFFKILTQMAPHVRIKFDRFCTII